MMRISSTGNRKRREDGFTLVELLSVLMIISLFSTLAIMAVRAQPTELESFKTDTVRTLNAALQNGTVSGRLQAMQISDAGLTILDVNQITPTPLSQVSFPENARVMLSVDGTAIKRERWDETLLLFEPTGEATRFVMTVFSDGQRLDVTSSGDGRLTAEFVQ